MRMGETVRVVSAAVNASFVGESEELSIGVTPVVAVTSFKTCWDNPSSANSMPWRKGSMLSKVGSPVTVSEIWKYLVVVIDGRMRWGSLCKTQNNLKGLLRKKDEVFPRNLSRWEYKLSSVKTILAQNGKQLWLVKVK